jgi:malonyl CoA-acyl carrier protein transacylase
MLAVTGLLQSELERKIAETNKHLEAENRGTVGISLFNGLKAFTVTGPPASLVGLVQGLRQGKAKSGQDQSKVRVVRPSPLLFSRYLYRAL